MIDKNYIALMKKLLILLSILFCVLGLIAFNNKTNMKMSNVNLHQQDEYEIKHSDQEWKQLLTPEQYDVLRKQGTEQAYSGAYWNNKRVGTYYCAATGEPLFSSKSKFKSGTGWPSFYEPINDKLVKLIEDRSHGVTRIEVVDFKSGSHLGHVFNDGPAPTGQRFCINSLSLIFVEEGSLAPRVQLKD